jgi:hypothetical protein
MCHNMTESETCVVIECNTIIKNKKESSVGTKKRTNKSVSVPLGAGCNGVALLFICVGRFS